MSAHVDPIPSSYRSAIPYLNVTDGLAALEFYKEAFSASETIRIMRKDGKLAHGEMKLGDATIMLRDEIPEMNFLSPPSVGGTPSEILIYVTDLEALVSRAQAAGASIIAPISEQFHGDLMAILKDPFGHCWFFATRIRQIPADRLAQRAAEWGI